MIKISRLLLIPLLMQNILSCTLGLTAHKTKENNIITISSMAEIQPFLQNAQLVIFDIDHTILEAKTRYCHSNWFYDHYDDAIKRGINKKRILDALVPPWEIAQQNCLVKPVEDITITIIEQLQKTNKKVMALTARSKAITDATITQLKSLGIDFSKSAPLQSDFISDRGYAQTNGILFASDYLTKGEVLKEYLDKADFHPHTVVMIDDVMHNLVSIEEVLHKKGIQVDTFFYPRVQQNSNNWDKALADKEWELHHGPIIY